MFIRLKIGILLHILTATLSISVTACNLHIQYFFQYNFDHRVWNETKQLALFVSNEYCGYYGYNANGERVYKLTGTVLADQYDAGDVNIETYFDDMVLYVNPYMVVTPRGYTKHYYNGNQRIAARLGNYWMDSGTIVDESGIMSQAREVLEDRLNSGNTDEECFEEEYYYSEEMGDIWYEPYTLRTTYSSCAYVEDMLHSVFDGGTCMAEERYGIDKGIFYYHSDHLGSASWITDDQGQAVQYMHYMPFGESWENQKAATYNERYKFTGKERDFDADMTTLEHDIILQCSIIGCRLINWQTIIPIVTMLRLKNVLFS